MPRGFWDWGVNPGGIATAPEVTLAELASRLGSIAVFDRRGEAILLDSFETGTTNWISVITGGSAQAILTAASSRHGGYAYQTDTDAVNNDSVTLSRLIPPHDLARMGLEVSFTLPSAADNGAPQAAELNLQLDVGDGAVMHRGAIRLTNLTGQWAALNAAGSYQSVGVADVPYARSKVYHTCKLVLDMDTDTYVRAMFDTTTLPVAGSALRTFANTQAPLINIVLSITTLAAAVASNRWDDVILTQNEP